MTEEHSEPTASAPTGEAKPSPAEGKAPRKGKRTCITCLLIAGGVGIAALLVAYFVGMSQLGPIAKRTIEGVGSTVAGVPVTVDSVSVTTFSSGTVHGLSVASPAGFRNPTLLAIDKAGGSVDLGSLRTNRPLVHSLSASGVRAAVEAGEFDCNLGLVLDSVKEKTGAEGSSGSGELPAIIKKTTLTDVEVLLAGQDPESGYTLAIEKVTGSPEVGRFEIRNATVGNPKGFDSKEAKSLESAVLEVDPATYLSVPVVVKSLTAKGVRSSAEVSGGKSNLSVMTDVVRAISERLGAGGVDTTVLPVDVLALVATDVRLSMLRTAQASDAFDVSIASVTGSIHDGVLNAETLSVQSPPGFDSKQALTIPKATVAFDPNSLLTGAPHIRSVQASNIQASAETGPSGNNVGIILGLVENLLASLADGESAGSAIAVDSCAIDGITVRLRSTGQGADAERLSATLASVRGNPSAGRLTVENVNVSNPPGYTSDKAFTLGKIEATFQFASLFTDLIVVDEVIVTDIEGVYETSVKGTNFTAIERELAAFEESMGSSEGTKGWVIKNLYLKNVRGQLSPSLLRNVGVRPPATLQDMHLKDLRSDSSAAMLTIIVQQVRPGFDNVGAGLLKGIGVIGEGAGTAVKEVGKGVGEGVGTVIKGIFGRGGEKETEGTEGAEDPAPAE